MAIVIRSQPRDDCTSAHLGDVVRVDRALAIGSDAWWELVKPLRCLNCGCLRHELRDADLHPIRPARAEQEIQTTEEGS